MKIGRVDTKENVALIAEIGNNHEGSVNLAEELIGLANEAGADGVKLQCFIPELYVSKNDEDRIKQLKRFALTESNIEQLFNFARKSNIHLFATPFDLESARNLSKYVKTFKVASGDVTFTTLIEYLSKFGKDIIISTGASTLNEVIDAINLIKTVWNENKLSPELAILHCESAYPAEKSSLNLRVIQKLKSQFPSNTIGFSDHTIGIESALNAVAAGAYIIEKHFTIDKNYSSFRDHTLSADSKDLKELKSRIMELEKELGIDIKKPHVSEIESIKNIRRSFAAARDIKKGTKIEISDLVCIRPQIGIPSNQIQKLISKEVKKDIIKGEIIEMVDLE